MPSFLFFPTALEPNHELSGPIAVSFPPSPQFTKCYDA